MEVRGKAVDCNEVQSSLLGDRFDGLHARLVLGQPQLTIHGGSFPIFQSVLGRKCIWSQKVSSLSVHSLNPLLSCLFVLSSSCPPLSLSAFCWRPSGQGLSATYVEQ